MTTEKQNSDTDKLKEKRSGKEQRSPNPRRKESRESWHAPRRQIKDRRKEKIYNTDMDSE